MFNFKKLWLRLFHTTTWLGIDIGFWVGMLVVLIIVILMTVVFLSLKPKDTANKSQKSDKQ